MHHKAGAFYSNGDTSVDAIGPYLFMQGKKGVRVTGDSALLAQFIAGVAKKDSIIELGSGSGAIMLQLAWQTPSPRIIGVEVEEASFKTSIENINVNKLNGRLSAVNMDFRDLKSLFPKGSFSIVAANPPYTKAGAGRISANKQRAGARSEVFGSLRDVISISGYLASERGRIFYVFPTGRLAEMLDELKRFKLRPRRLRFIHSGGERQSKAFLIEAGRGVEGGLKVEEPVFV